MSTLLPPASTAFERAVEQTAAARINALNPPIKSLWNPDTCPEAVLPFLAWALSVDEWDDMWSPEKKRASIREARYIHQHKGTRGALRRALAALGQGDADIIERTQFIRCNGTVTCDGSHTCHGRWATAKINLKHAVTVGDAYRIRRLLNAVKRNAVLITEINFAAAAFRCDGTIRCNGDYACGAVNTTLNQE